MKIAVIGGGGREHAIIKKLKLNPTVERIYALPGNGGMTGDAECVPIKAMELDKIVTFCREKAVDFVVIAPDDPLIAGLKDMLNAVGIPSFGPDKAAAEIEGSKAFAKELMKKYRIPTAAYEVFTDEAAALAYVDGLTPPVVVKADGPALGKGVIIAESIPAAREAVHSMMSESRFGDSGKRVVIEEFLTGPEVSVLAFTDSHTLVPMVSSMDHKRAGDGDTGLNTGGMGVVAPNPYYTKAVADRAMREIFIPTLNAMNAEGRPFKGCLYFGLMITADGPKVIEYNSRFGDPETQAVLPLLKSDLLQIMLAVEEERLSEVSVEFMDKSSCALVLASKGYPEKYETGYEITENGVQGEIFYAGVKRVDGKIVTSGGRVLAVTEVRDDLADAIAAAYADADRIDFKTKYFRHDIGQRALAAKK